ncbi:MAG TPA: hypothetical protein VEL28_13380 [Candidatus Binatia bacterium]|nr:hypothetical protein [Candidatus Binatia bacterium]
MLFAMVLRQAVSAAVCACASDAGSTSAEVIRTAAIRAAALITRLEET